jgi:hypothetical protein
MWSCHRSDSWITDLEVAPTTRCNQILRIITGHRPTVYVVNLVSVAGTAG